MSTRTWRAGLARGWRLAAAAVVLLAVGLALLAGGSGSGLHFEDLALDDGASRTQGSVTGIDADADGEDWVRVRYAFVDLDGRPVLGSCWDRVGAATVGIARTVEFLAREPSINRLQHGRRAVDDRRSTWPMGLLVLPAVLLLLFWLRGAAHWVNANP